jgi:hypothetical protein
MRRSGRLFRHGGMKLVVSRRIDQEIHRAPNAAPGNPPLGKNPRGYFSSAGKGGGVEQDLDLHTNHSRNFRLEDPPQFFFGQIFWEKILEIKIVLLASPMQDEVVAGSGEHGVDAIAASRGGS